MHIGTWKGALNSLFFILFPAYHLLVVSVESEAAQHIVRVIPCFFFFLCASASILAHASKNASSLLGLVQLGS